MIDQLTWMGIHANPDVTCYGHKAENGKFTGGVYLIDAKERPRLMISTQPVFDTEESAKAKMQEIVNIIKSTPVDKITPEFYKQFLLACIPNEMKVSQPDSVWEII